MFENYLDIKLPEDLNFVSYSEPTPTSDFLSIISPQGNNSWRWWMPSSGQKRETSSSTQEVSSNNDSSIDISTNNTYTSDTLPKDKKEFVLTLFQEYQREINEYNNTHDDKIDPKYIIDLIAHDTIESAWGNHALGFNLGGIKASENSPHISANTVEYINGKKVHIRDNFRKFNSLSEYVKYKINMLTHGRYAKVGVFHGDYVHGLKAAGYFTAPESQYKAMLNDRKKKVEKLLQ